MDWSHAANIAVPALWAAREFVGGMAMYLPAPRADDGTFYRVLFAAANVYSRGHARNVEQPEPQRMT